ncbi:MAG: hypothetical protein ABS939_00405 [Psychrobacillus sp.]
MSRKRTREYKNGDTLTAYINNTVDENLLDWLNKQSDVTGAIFLALLKLYEETGHIDVVDYIPRRYSVDVPLPNFPGQSNNKSQVPVVPTQASNVAQPIISSKPIESRESNDSLDKQPPPPLTQDESDVKEQDEQEQPSWLGGLENINVDNY